MDHEEKLNKNTRESRNTDMGKEPKVFPDNSCESVALTLLHSMRNLWVFIVNSLYKFWLVSVL